MFVITLETDRRKDCRKRQKTVGKTKLKFKAIMISTALIVSTSIQATKLLTAPRLKRVHLANTDQQK